MTPNNTQQPPSANPVGRQSFGQTKPAQLQTSPSASGIQQPRTMDTNGLMLPPGSAQGPTPNSTQGSTQGLTPEQINTGMTVRDGRLTFGQNSGPTALSPVTAGFLGLTPNANGNYTNSSGQVGGLMQPAGSNGSQAQFPTSPVAQKPGQTTPYSTQPMQVPNSAPQVSNSANGQMPPTNAPAVGQNPISQIPGLTDFISRLQGQQLPGGVQNSVNTSNVPGLVGGDALRQQTQQAQQAAYQQATGYLDPQFANQENQLRNSLINQGIPQNSEAWNRAMDDFQRQKTFAYQQAQNAAVQQGLQAQGQLFGQGLAANQNQFGQNLSGGQFTNAAQNQVAQQVLQQLGMGTQLGMAGIGGQTAANQLGEQFAQDNFGNSMAMRNQDINELLLQQQNPLQMYQALTQGNSVQTPSFTNTPGSNIGGTDIASIINQALGQQNNVYNAQVGAQNSNTAAAATIIAALLSDRKLKTNIRMIGRHEIGVPVYTFDYVWGEPGIGVMADEVEKVMPHAVFQVGPYQAVNYAEFSKVA